LDGTDDEAMVAMKWIEVVQVFGGKFDYRDE
jgi:hypothetical protein